MKANKLLYILPLAVLTACEPDIEEIDVNNGTADFSTYVSLGNSLTAGYQSNALRREKQMVSFPSMIAEQLEKVGGGAFKQPLLADGVGVGASGNAEFGLFLKPDCQGNVGPAPGPIAPAGQFDQFAPSANIGAQGPFNNVGVPGAKSYHLVAEGYGNPANLQTMPPKANPFYARFANPADYEETVLEQALRANPTFFTLFIGNNDVLGYSTTGGSGNANTGLDPSAYGLNDITNTTVFGSVYDGLLAGLTANGAKGAVANIPDVTSIPYFTTVKWNALVLTQEQADLFNNYPALVQYNAALDLPTIRAQFSTDSATAAAEAARRKISFTAGANGFVTIDNNLSAAITGGGPNDTLPKIRLLKAGELVTLMASGDDIRCKGLGSADFSDPMNPRLNPMPDLLVLDEEEVAAVAAATAGYNQAIKNLAGKYGLAFVDANAKLRELATSGITTSGVSFSSAYISGGAFSLDGVHPSTRGYAIIANEFIKAINATYNANVPQVDVTSYETIVSQ